MTYKRVRKFLELGEEYNERIKEEYDKLKP